MLTLIAQYALEGTPRAFDIDPTGKFIYVGGQTSGKLTVFRIDTSNGKLIHLHTYDVGESLVWVFIVQMDAESSTKK
jgi:6-phosphogluconolactonase